MYAVYTKENGGGGGGQFLRHIVDGRRFCHCYDVTCGHHCFGRVFPVSVAMCGDLVLVADADSCRVSAFRYDDGTFVKHVANGDGLSGHADGRLKMPCAVAVYADTLALVADATDDRVSVFRISDGAFVRHLQHAEMRYPNGVAVCGDLAVISDGGNAEIAVFRIDDGALVRRIRVLDEIVTRLGGKPFPRSIVIQDVAVHGDVAFVVDMFNYYTMAVRLSDGALLPSMAIKNHMRTSTSLAVYGDVLLMADKLRGCVRAHRIADGTLAYCIGGDDAEDESGPMHPCGLAVRGDTLLVCDAVSDRVSAFRLPAVVRWRPDVDVHARFGDAFRDIIQTVLGIATQPARSLSRLPLELVCVVASELAHV